MLARVAAERGLDFEPPPAPVLDALPGLTHTVEDVSGRCRDEQERRWLAAALAALSHHVQVSTLPEPRHHSGVTSAISDHASPSMSW
jgi:hypothetical protein